MSAILPGSERFEIPVYGTIFGSRAATVRRLAEGDRLILVPDPPGTEEPMVWVHATGGDVVGHVSPDIARWLAPFMLSGARCSATVAHLAGDDVASWKRLVIAVRCVKPG